MAQRHSWHRGKINVQQALTTALDHGVAAPRIGSII